MIRKAFFMKLRPGQFAAYYAAHNPIPAELAATIRAHGIGNYSIYHHPETDTLCAVMEIADEAELKHLGDHECCRIWWRAMCEYLETAEPGATKAREEEMPEIFHLA